MDTDINKTCCVTGHRDILPNRTEYVEQELRKEIQIALNDGYIRFVSGFANGADLLFAKIVIEHKAKFDYVFLEAALPIPAWRRKGYEYNLILQKCDLIKVHSPKYSDSCFSVRNRYMVDISDRIIAVYDGRKRGGTVNTLNYARSLGKDVHIIQI